MARKPAPHARLEQALAERDRALQALAEARSELDALKLRNRRPDEQAPPLYPDSAEPSLAPPLRYVLVDKLNERAKRVLGPAFTIARRWMARR